VVIGMLMLSFAAGADAISKPIAIGSNASGLPSTPAVAVDPTGAAYIAWLNPPADTVLTFCKLAVGATKCDPVSLTAPDPSHAQYFDPPSILVNGTDVYVFEDVGGAANQNQDGMYEWVSTDGGATFTPLPYAVSYTAVGDTAGTGPMPVVPLFGGNVGFGYVAAAGNPVFQTNSLVSPTNYSPGAFPPTSPPPPFATLGQSPLSGAYAADNRRLRNRYVIGNLGGEIVSQLTGTTGLLGVFELIETGPCPSNEGLVFTYAPISASTTNAALDTSPYLGGSPWSVPAGVQCNTESPALTSGPSGLGLLFTNDASLTHATTEFRRFTAPATFGAAVKVASGAAFQPSLTQDGAGGLYATWLSNGTGLRFAYGEGGGGRWFGPVTLFSEKGGAVGVDGIASATNGSGQGWAAFESGGREYAQPFVAADALPPTDSHLKLAPKSFSPSKGTKVRYDDTEAAATTFSVLLLRTGHKPQPIGAFHHADRAGKNSVHWNGEAGGHLLAAGSYELEATPKLGALKGKTISVKFTVS
jgi:hypothetical protein